MHIDLYSSIAGINAFFRKMDVSANNVANMNTDNYKRRVAAIGQNENGHPSPSFLVIKATSCNQLKKHRKWKPYPMP